MNTLSVGSAARIDLARLEWLKWLAFAAMVVDHVDLLLLGRSWPWAYEFGRLAFPLFAVTFGVGLAASRDAGAVAKRLALPAALAQLAWMIAQPGYPINVLAGFALCAAAVRWHWTAPLVLGLSVFGEGGPLLLVLVGGGFLAGRLGVVWPVLIAGALWAVAAPTAGAVVAVVLLVVSSAIAGPRVPRVAGFLQWGYVAHLAALSVLVLV